MNLNNAKVLVTGGSLGIGKATAKKLKEAGAQVVITGRNEVRLQAAANELGVRGIAMDVANTVDIKRTVSEAQEYMGGLNVLINNAGIGAFDLLDELTLEQFETVFGINVFGAALMAQEVAKVFKAQNYGNIINIASTAGTKGFERGTVYAASKFALRGMTQCWQAELRKFNVRVMLVNPSEVKTAFANPDRTERPEEPNKLRGEEIAHAIKATLEMDDRGMIPELTVWATNPW